MPKPWFWLTGLVVVFAISAAMFLSTAKYARKESVRGWLVASDGVARIAHDVPGVVESIAVKVGEAVVTGDPLIYLSHDTFLENGRSSSDELIAELVEQSAAIARREQLLTRETGIELQLIRTQLSDLAEEQQAISRRSVEQQRRLNAAAQKLTRLETAVESGVVSEWEVLQQKDELAVLKQAMDQLRQSSVTLKRERSRLTARENSLPIETERLIAGLQTRLSELRQEITRLETRQRVVLMSPIDGKLASLEVYQGSSFESNQLLATVIPETLALVAEAYVPSHAIGFIKRGQRVRLVYDAFPAQQFGAFAGVVEHVSEFVLLPSEVPQTFYPREATFKIRIAIERDVISIREGWAPLRPGMLLAAEIILESRSLFDWLLGPIRLRRHDTA